MKVSVIMPVYNTKQWVGEAIESILNQTYKDFEFIIVDDCSTDGSYEICKEYAKKDKRIRLYRNEKNEGISYTRNRLISLTTTDYILTQDSDDVSTSDRLKQEYDFLSQHKEYGVVSGDNEIIDEEGKRIGLRKYSDNIMNVILKKSPVSNPTTMFRKDYFLQVGGYEEGLNYGEDYDVWLKFYLNGYKIKNLDKVLLKYRVREGQTKSDKLKQTLRNTIKLQEKYIKLGIKASISDRVYIILEKCLLMLPSNIILKLFKIISY